MTTTREQWLMDAIAALRPMFQEKGIEIPEVRVSVGWPGGRGSKSDTIGQCWNTECSADKKPQIFISPVVSEPLQALATLAHEMIHAADDCTNGHRGPFGKWARAIGLEGKLTATYAGPELESRLISLQDELGNYPHSALKKSAPKKQTTRMIKVMCPSCDYTVRTTAKWIEVGLPTCPCGTEMEKS